MKTYTDQQIAQMYDNLPEDLKDAIFSVEMSSVVEKIGRENQLNIEQIGDLANETGMVMLGVTHPDEFISNLSERLEIDKEKSSLIAHKVNDQIFKPVRNSLRKIHNIRDEANQPKVRPSVDEGRTFGVVLPTIEPFVEEKKDILKEIEKDHTKEIAIPDIMKGDINPFEEKMKEGVFNAPVEEKRYIEEKPEEKKPPANLPTQEKSKNYKATDPYREPIE